MVARSKLQQQGSAQRSPVVHERGRGFKSHSAREQQWTASCKIPTGNIFRSDTSMQIENAQNKTEMG